jgi:hypothetical protein
MAKIHPDLFVSAYTICGPTYNEVSHPFDIIEIVRTGKIGASLADTDVWAIRCLGQVLNRKGKWEYEPLPSSRSNAFLTRCRFTLAEAKEAAQKAVKERTPGSLPGVTVS